MNVQAAIADFRSPKRADYPELAGYAREEIYDQTIGGGALYLAAKMVRTMHLRPGDVVLDLGCGKGATSIFLVRHFGVRVIAVDLWTSATELDAKFARRGYRDRIVPLHLDASCELPFADEYFDAIFSMNSFSFYGGSVEFVGRLLRHLKPGGQLCIGSEVLTDEFTPEQLQSPPPVYSFKLPPPNQDVDVFEGDFIKQHTAAWWENLLDGSGLLHVTHCAELDDADILYEDMVLYNVEHNLDPEDVQICIQQIEWGKTNRPRKSLFVITGNKL